jgi:hypothetical protein
MLVRKVSGSLGYNPRLMAQKKKQEILFAALDPALNVTVPEVMNSGFEESTGLFWYDMSYIPGERFSEFCIRLPLKGLEEIVLTYIRLIETGIGFATVNASPKDLIHSKIDALKSSLASKTEYALRATRLCEEAQDAVPSTPIPIGLCHGDLTLSNVILHRDKLVLLDCLDSFLESPLLDLVKLRQDTKHHWSVFIDHDIPDYAHNRIIQVMRFFDSRITQALSSNKIVNDWYSFLERLNFLRILPYLSERSELEFVLRILEEGDFTL